MVAPDALMESPVIYAKMTFSYPKEKTTKLVWSNVLDPIYTESASTCLIKINSKEENAKNAQKDAYLVKMTSVSNAGPSL